MDSNFDMDLAIEQGCDEAQRFIDQLRKNKQKDMSDVRLLDAFLRQIPIPPIQDRPRGALPLKGLGLGVVQSALRTPNSPILNPSTVLSSVAVPSAVKNGSAREAIDQLPKVSALPSTNTGALKEAATLPAQGSTTSAKVQPDYWDLDKIPSEWKSAATKYVPILVKAFQAHGIDNLHVFAYACATICYESSWNPKAVNTTDAAAKTGYPGAGLAQITWKDNYEMVTRKTGIDFVNHPEYMFDPEKSLRAKAAFYQENGMIPYIEKGDYESAAGIYNAGRASFRSSYTRNVAHDTPLWLPVFLGEGKHSTTSLVKENKDSRGTADLTGEIKLEVDYYSQVDSKTSQAERMCFSSTCAMALKYLRPDALSGPNADDTYLGTVFKYGDTTDPTAQVKALKSYGINAYYKQNLSFKDLDEQLMKRLPVAVGWLHHGSVDHPLPGGHWCLVVGRKADGSAYYFMDPYGEADLVNGGHTPNEDGRYMIYSKRNWGPRWQVEGEGTGWGVIFEKPH